MNPLILTICHTNHRFLLNQFLPSLRDVAQYRGAIAVLGYELPEEIKNKIQTFGATVYDFPIRNTWNETVNFHRMNDFLAVLENNDCSRVLYADSGDIFAQYNIDGLWQDELGMASEGHTWGSSEWGRDVLKRLPKKCETLLGPAEILNFGVFTANRDNFVEFCKLHTQLVQHCDNKHYFGVDQALACYLYYYGFISTRLLNKTYNYVTQCNDWCYNDGLVVDKPTNCVPSLIHDAGSRPCFRSGLMNERFI